MNYFIQVIVVDKLELFQLITYRQLYLEAWSMMEGESCLGAFLLPQGLNSLRSLKPR